MKKAIVCILMLCILLAHVPCLGEEMTGVFDFENKTVLLNSGYTMPILGLGTYALDHDACVNSVMALIENGGRLIDTAYMYGNEEAVGEGVRLAMAEYGVPREEIFVITKIYPSQFSDPEAAIEMALGLATRYRGDSRFVQSGSYTGEPQPVQLRADIGRNGTDRRA